jgi:hypothetical protein
MPICKLLFLKNLCSKTLGKIQNRAPHRLMSRLKSKTIPGLDPSKIQKKVFRFCGRISGGKPVNVFQKFEKCLFVLVGISSNPYRFKRLQ